MVRGKPRSGPDPKDESRVRLLPVDPYLIHAYWEIIDKDLETARSQLGSVGAQIKLVLRFYDITYILFDGKNAHGFFDVEIDPAARNWYVQLWSPEKSYCADLGLKTSEGRFLAFVRSNVTHTPPAWPSIREEERHMRDNPEAELITEHSPQLSIPSRGEFSFPFPGKAWEKPEYLLNGQAPRKERTGGEPGSLKEKGASRKVKELNTAVPFIDRGMRNFDLAKLNEQHFSRSISSWRPQSEED
jgi:hypothetical protein